MQEIQPSSPIFPDPVRLFTNEHLSEIADNVKNTLLILTLLLAGKVCAQHYTRDAGLRVGDCFTATYRQHLDDERALEGMASIGRGGFTCTVLKEFFIPAFSSVSQNLFFQYAFGAHVGFRNVDHYQVLNRTYVLDEKRVTPLLGVDGGVGLEYRFTEFPVVMGFDWRPYFEYSTTQIFSIYLQSVGFSFKYRF